MDHLILSSGYFYYSYVSIWCTLEEYKVYNKDVSLLLLTYREQEWIKTNLIFFIKLFNEPPGDARDRNCIPL